MNNKIKSSLLSLMFLVLIPTTVTATGLTDFSGRGSNLSEHTGNGKWLVVMLWASYCHVCNDEAHQYNQFHLDHHGKDASVIGVSLDGAAGQAEAEAFVRRHDIAFPNLIGEPERVADLYQTLTGTPWRGTPSFLVYGPDGELAAKQEGAVPIHLIEAFISKNSKVE